VVGSWEIGGEFGNRGRVAVTVPGGAVRLRMNPLAGGGTSTNLYAVFLNQIAYTVICESLGVYEHTMQILIPKFISGAIAALPLRMITIGQESASGLFLFRGSFPK